VTTASLSPPLSGPNTCLDDTPHVASICTQMSTTDGLTGKKKGSTPTQLNSADRGYQERVLRISYHTLRPLSASTPQNTERAGSTPAFMTTIATPTPLITTHGNEQYMRSTTITRESNSRSRAIEIDLHNLELKVRSARA
jgi:hypothetical protein